MNGDKMFYVIRFTYPNGIEGEEMENETDEFKNADEAIDFAHENTFGLEFAGTLIENDNGDTIYEITSDMAIVDHR